jgi:aspartate/methionine/tyrosine aminotransferase
MRWAQIFNAREYSTISNTPVAELLAEIAVKHREQIWGRVRQVAGANLRLLDAMMARQVEQLAWVRPQGGMTAFPWLVSGDNARGFCERALERGVLLAPGDCFEAPNHFRLGVSQTWFPEALTHIEQLVEPRAAPR